MPLRKNESFGITILEDISTLILHSHDLQETLVNIVTLVAKRMRTDVCSLYLADEGARNLRLMASKGLSQRAVGKVVMKVDEGLTGLAFEEKQVVSLIEPQNHPRYRYFKETREERFHTFLGIPLFDRENPLGVLVLQTKQPREFSKEEISALSTIAFQVSSIVINARLLDSIRDKENGNQAIDLPELPESSEPELNRLTTLRGTIAASGIASGPAHLMGSGEMPHEIQDSSAIDVDREITHLQDALEKTRIQTIYLEKRMAERLSDIDASIFHSHLMILEDHGFVEKITKVIQRGVSAAYAVQKIVGDYVEAFGRMEDPYLQERGADMKDIGRRLMGNLTGQVTSSELKLRQPGIIVAHEILPSDMAVLDHEMITGIVTEVGGTNSHAVIMAKSLGIPSLVAVENALKRIDPGDNLILDANSGCLYVHPTPEISEEYARLEQERHHEINLLAEFRTKPGLSKDGIEVQLRANIGLLSDVNVARSNGAEGVGLYRTEFPYMTRTTFPDRDDQVTLYRKVIEGFDGMPVTIRTLDIGGDKGLPYFESPKEDNPFMGWRSVRVSLDNRDIFRTQIEAILMAGAFGPVKLLFPMISSVSEIRACKEVVQEARNNLRHAGIAHAEHVPLGIMIEVPAAVQMADRLAREVDFFALGTNDLVQYLLAADRNNPLVHKYYDIMHPGVLRAIAGIIASTSDENIDLCICGEMGSDPLGFLVLFGLGVREFSMPAPLIPRLKAFLAGLDSREAETIALHALDLEESSLIREYLCNEVSRIAPELKGQPYLPCTPETQQQTSNVKDR